MTEQRSKMRLNDAQRRTLATSLGLLDQTLSRFEEYAKGREIRSVMWKEENRLSAEQRDALLTCISEIKALLARMKEDLNLPARVDRVAATIWGESAAFWNTLAEVKSQRLAAYGKVDPSLASYVDPKVERLISAMQAIADIVSGKSPVADR